MKILDVREFGFGRKCLDSAHLYENNCTLAVLNMANMVNIRHILRIFGCIFGRMFEILKKSDLVGYMRMCAKCAWAKNPNGRLLCQHFHTTVICLHHLSVNV